mgnify:CR=1 FL=1
MRDIRVKSDDLIAIYTIKCDLLLTVRTACDRLVSNSGIPPVHPNRKVLEWT